MPGAVHHPPGYQLCADPTCETGLLGGYTNRHLHHNPEEKPVTSPSTIPDESLAYLEKLRAHGLQIAVGTAKGPIDHIPAGSVWIADTALDSMAFVRREALADLVIMIVNDLLDEDETAIDYIRGATGL